MQAAVRKVLKQRVTVAFRKKSKAGMGTVSANRVQTARIVSALTIKEKSTYIEIF